GGRAARWLPSGAQEGRRRLRSTRPARRDELLAAALSDGPGGDRTPLCRSGARGPAPALQYGRRPAQLAVGKRALPRFGGSGKDQRQPTLTDLSWSFRDRPKAEPGIDILGPPQRQ